MTHGFGARRLSLLVARGYEVVGQASSAAEGMALASAIRPDAVLLDVNLPDGDGLALTVRLAAARGPRILLTSSDPTAAPARLTGSCGAVGFLAKEDLADVALDTYLMS
jgi:DNA-binding NarL/FixJ family response regulator